MSMLFSLICAVMVSGAATSDANIEYLSVRQDRLLYAQQAWGELGIDVCAHAGGQAGLPMKVKDKTYTRGLGHHAGGEILVELNGDFERFEAEVGVQTQSSPAGSVVFQVFVDDEKKYDSGIVRNGEEAKPVKVSVLGAQELKLVVTDAGDGIVCDCANWAEARLVRNPDAKAVAKQYTFDVARFARVVASDPARTDGSKSNRVQEYRAEDIYLETDMVPDADGAYIVPAVSNGLGSIGLRWIERRLVRRLEIEFADAASMPSSEKMQVQFWAGESPYQGGWKPLKGEWIVDGVKCAYRVEPQGNPALRGGTWKVRWILPVADKPLNVRRLFAYTPAVLVETNLRIEFEPAEKNSQVKIDIYNGEILSHKNGDFKVRYCKPRKWQAERTVIRFQLPDGGFGVAMDDVLANKAVYVPAYGTFVALADAKLTPAEYKKQIAGRETMLDEVRRLPDQTFAQAIEHVHHDTQNKLPTLLSLACDNHKFIVHRDGMTQFMPPGDTSLTTRPDQPHYSCQFRPIFGSGKNEQLTRKLAGDWLPAPVVTVVEKGVTYRQCSFVTPYALERKVTGNPWLNDKPLYVASFTIENTGEQEAEASLQLAFLADVSKKQSAEVKLNGSRATVSAGDQVLAVVDAQRADTLKLSAEAGTMTLQSKIGPGQRVACCICVPGWKPSEDEVATFADDAASLKNFQMYWQRVLSSSMQITTPDSLLNNVIMASQVHCLIAARNEDDGKRIAAWAASLSYGALESEANSIIRAMAFLGHDEFACRSHDYFIHRYDPSGCLTTGYTLMGTGWQLWTLGEYYALSHNQKWLKAVAPKVANVCSWITKQRAKTRDVRVAGQLPIEAGLMPPGVMADWNAFAYYFCLNGYYYAGLKAAADALADIGWSGAADFQKNAAEFREDILRAFRATQAKMPVYPLRNGTSVPGYPSQLLPGPTGPFFPGEDGNRSWCYDVELGSHQLVPHGVLPADSRDVTWMMDHMEDVQFLADGWFDFSSEMNHKDPYNLGGFSKVQPYYTRNAEIYALRDDVKAFVRSYFNTIPSLLNMENLSFQEHFNGVAAWNKTHETGYFLVQTRIMLVQERGEELWLAPMVTNNWLKDGQKIEVAMSPTRFGTVGYRIASSIGKGYIEASIEPPDHTLPKQIVLRLRHPEGKPMRAVTVNGRSHADFDIKTETIRIKPGPEPIRIKAEY